MGVNIDHLVKITSSTIFKPTWAPILLLWLIRRADPATFSFALQRKDITLRQRIPVLWTAIREILGNNRWLAVYAVIVTARCINAIGHRLIMNPLKPRQIQWKDHVIVVSGGARGIAGRTVEYLVNRGAKVVALDRAPYSAHGTETLYISADVTDQKSLQDALDLVHKKLGRVTMVVAGAGIARHALWLDDPKIFPCEYQTQIHDVNLTGLYNFVKIFSQDMVPADGSRTGTPKNGWGGHIFLIGSGSAYTALPGNASYSASKAGVVSLYNTLSFELDVWFKHKGIRSSVICPLKVESDMTRGRMEDQKNQFLFPTLTIDQVAHRIVSHLGADESGQIFMPSSARALSILSQLPEWTLRGFAKLFGASDTFMKWTAQNRTTVADH